MIRTVAMMAGLALLSACGGGDRRAEPARAAYVPVTPGAQPVVLDDGTVLAGPIAVTPGAVPILDDAGQARLVVAAASRPVPRPAAPAQPAFATGPIHDACRGAGRRDATRARCGCVQWVADRELTPQQQRRGAGYFTNQHGLQEVRQSDDRANEDFWQAWSRFGARADDLCRGA